MSTLDLFSYGLSAYCEGRMIKDRFLLASSLLCLIVAVALRLYLWPSAPASFDELIQFDLLWRNNSLWGTLQYNALHDYQFPLHYILTYPLVKLGGKSLMLMRLVPMVWGILGLIVFYRICHLRFPKKEQRTHRFFSVALYALSLPVLYFSFIARPYGAMIFFTLLTLYLLEKRARLWPYLSALILLGLTHLFGLFMAIVFALFWAKRELSAQNFKKILLLIGPVFILFWAIYLTNAATLEEVTRRSMGLRKFLGVFPYIASGYGVFIAFCFLVLKKKFFNQWPFLSMATAILGVGVILNLLGLPAFEYRFFVGLVPMLILSLVTLLDLVSQEKKIYYGLTSLLLAQALAMPMVSGHKIFFKAPRVDLLLKDHGQMIGQQAKVVACGNCPRLYFAEDRHLSCLEGWDFSQNRQALEGMSALMVFEDNRNFCAKYVHAHFTKVLKYPGVTYFSK